MNVQQQSFERYLLERSNDEKMRYFSSVNIDHAIHNKTYEGAINSICCSSGPRVIVITGPTGVGKSTLGRRLFRTVQKLNADEANADKSIVPVIGVNAAPPSGSSFNWRDFYTRILLVNKDILLDKKICLSRQTDMFSNGQIHSIEGSDADTLRRTLESNLAHRKTKYLFIDEAHHILMAKDRSRMEFQFEMLKSLTIESDITIVLLGTYDLLDIRDYSGQLVRRSEIFHMDRYNPNLKEHRDEFASTLDAIISKMPLKIKPDLTKHSEYFFTKSVGCIGILKDWLTRTYWNALTAGMDTFDQSFADQYALNNKGLRTIIEEALIGESKMRDEPYENLSELLFNGLDLKSRFVEVDALKPRLSKNKGQRICIRKPVRDPVGGVKYAE